MLFPSLFGVRQNPVGNEGIYCRLSIEVRAAAYRGCLVWVLNITKLDPPLSLQSRNYLLLSDQELRQP